MTWNPIDTPIDFFALSGQQSPGYGTVENAEAERDWDEVKGYGWSGGFSRFKGRKLARFNLIVRLETPEHWNQWAFFKPLIAKPPFGKRPKSLDVWHPWLEEIDVRSCVVLKDVAPAPTDAGIWTFKIPMLEWRAPKLTLAKPIGPEETKSTDPFEQIIKRKNAEKDAARDG